VGRIPKDLYTLLDSPNSLTCPPVSSIVPPFESEKVGVFRAAAKLKSFMQVSALIEQLQDFTDVSDLLTPELWREAAKQVADELVALQSIFGEDSVGVLPPKERAYAASLEDKCMWQSGEPIRLWISVPLDESNNDQAAPFFKLSATLPCGYPQLSHPPQLQLLSRYIGPHGVDHVLFGQILRLYHQSSNNNDDLFHAGEVALFDGIEKVRERVEEWYNEKEAHILQRREGDEDRQDFAQIRKIAWWKRQGA
jgi:hypothetical protein